jgi:hypothetical protein
MLFMHTQQIIQKQEGKRSQTENEEDEDDEQELGIDMND